MKTVFYLLISILLAADVEGNYQLLKQLSLFAQQKQLNVEGVSSRCSDDMQYWMASLGTFLNSIAMNCSQTDQECIKIQQQLTQENMFSAYQVDSVGKIPANVLGMNSLWMGSWEECMDVEAPAYPDYKTHFCYVRFGTQFALEAMENSGFAGSDPISDICHSAGSIRWSVCMPKSCSSQDVSLMFQSLNNSTYLTSGLMTFCGATCQPTEGPKKDAAFWVVIAYCILGGALMLVATVLDYCTDFENEGCKRFRKNGFIRCLLTFSMYTNGAEILDGTKKPGQISCLDCMRVFSITWVILGHYMMNYLYGDNVIDYVKSTSYFFNDALLNPFFAVDTYLFIGGLLLAYIFYRDMDKNPRKIRSPSYWFLFYVHRILRLSPPYFLFIGIAATMYDHLTIGPMPKFMLDPEACRKNWWRNILYINNLFDPSGMCMGHTWYLSVDMQIHIFSPILLVPLFLSKIAGAISALLLLALTTAANYATFAKYEFPATFSGFFGDVFNSAKLEKYEQYMYFATWIRYSSYLVGVLTGYFLHKTRGKKLWMHPILAIALWIASVALGVGAVYSLYDYLQGPDHNISVMARASYYNWSRIGWALALSWVVIACQNNWAGPVKNFMELSFWAPFGKLTYCVYLTHYLVVVTLVSLERQPMHFVNCTETYIRALPVFVVSYAFSFVWSCAFEIPFCKLERMLIAAVFGAGASRPRREIETAKITPASALVSSEKEAAWKTDEEMKKPPINSEGQVHNQFPNTHALADGGGTTPAKTTENGKLTEFTAGSDSGSSSENARL